MPGFVCIQNWEDCLIALALVILMLVSVWSSATNTVKAVSNEHDGERHAVHAAVTSRFQIASRAVGYANQFVCMRTVAVGIGHRWGSRWGSERKECHVGR